MSFLTQLNWRRAIKAFDSSKQVTEKDLSKILNAIRLAPTSYGLQPFKVYVVRSQPLKEKIRGAAYNQPQPGQAPVVLVFCLDSRVEDRTNEYAEQVLAGYPEVEEWLKTFKANIATQIFPKNEEQKTAWAAKQSYIALGFGLAAAAELEIDACPMEGFDPEAMDKVLELPPNLHSQALMAIGYRSQEPTLPKFRFPEEDLFVKRID